MADTQDNGRKSGLLGSLKSALGRLGGRGAKTGASESPATSNSGPAHEQTATGEVTAVPVPEELMPPAPAVAAPDDSSAPVVAETVTKETPLAEAQAQADDEAEAPAEAPKLVADVDLEPIAPEDVPVVGAEAISAEEAPSAQDETPFVEAPGDPVVDASWTVARLRTLARERGVRGYSSMSKAQLLGELSSPQA